jgi:hypothetical protein
MSKETVELPKNASYAGRNSFQSTPRKDFAFVERTLVHATRKSGLFVHANICNNTYFVPLHLATSRTVPPAFFGPIVAFAMQYGDKHKENLYKNVQTLTDGNAMQQLVIGNTARRIPVIRETRSLG